MPFQQRIETYKGCDITLRSDDGAFMARHDGVELVFYTLGAVRSAIDKTEKRLRGDSGDTATTADAP